MIALAVRGMAARKLRAALTGIAVLLGVAMIAGTYVLTDQITRAFEDITEQTVAKIDVVVGPDEAFTGSFTQPPNISEALVPVVKRIDGVAAAEGQVTGFGKLVVDGEVVETFGAPAFVFGASSEEFDPVTYIDGRRPRQLGEVSLLEQTLDDEDVELGDRIGIGTETGIKHAKVVGVFGFGEGGSSLGGTTAAALPPEQVQRWFKQQGEVATISVIADDGVRPELLRDRIAAVLPEGVRAQTASENAEESAEEINDQIGSFLTPALLALAGAAVLVGAFIIFNTSSITVAQRVREFAMLRALGATRRQILTAVVGEALLVGAIASGAGIAAGLGFAKGLSGLLDAAGFAVPRADAQLAPRTLAISLAVGLGVTLIAALVPAVRATRVPPIAAMSGVMPATGARRRRLNATIAALVTLAGAGLVAQGLFGSGPATGRLGAIAGGVVLLFIGVALSARYIVRPLAGAIGWPIERLFGTAGRLARENAERNPGRTAITSAALMVGVGLVVFVAVFAEGLKSSINRQVDELVRADIFVFSGDFSAMPQAATSAVRSVPGVETTVPVGFEQLEVNGENSNILYDLVLGLVPAKLGDVYSFDWLEGDDSLLGELTPGRTLIEEQFAKAHDLGVGDSYDAVTPSGRATTFTAIGIYRDPTILQGSIASNATLREISSSPDPFVVLATIAAGADAEHVEAAVTGAVRKFPDIDVENRTEYRETIADQVNQIVYLLYALLLMSVVISLFGIANSLFLSIHERTRELGTLRAIGATVRQIKRVIRYESVITSVIGGVLGTVVGIAFAWVVIESLSELGLGIAVPVGQIAGFLVLAVVVGIIGAIAPARQAARVDVLEAIRYE